MHNYKEKQCLHVLYREAKFACATIREAKLTEMKNSHVKLEALYLVIYLNQHILSVFVCTGRERGSGVRFINGRM